MTDLQKRFAEEYVVDYHISKAGQRAGIQGGNINVTAWKMLQLPEVQEYVEVLQAEAAQRSAIRKDEWIAEWAKLGFSNIQNYMNDDLSPKVLSKVKDPGVIKSIKKTVNESEAGTKTTVEFTLHDKVAGLTNIGRHFGWYSADNAQKTTNLTILNNDPLNDTSDNSTTEDQQPS